MLFDKYFIMLRNINQHKLCNGTRLSVKKLMTNIIEAKIFNRAFQRWRCPRPRIPMILTDMSFQFKRLQFSIRLTFVITINKAQGQSLELCPLLIDSHMGNYMLPVPDLAIQTISLSTHKMELPKILCIHNIGRCPWCNCYRRRKWTRRHEFKSWTRLIAFPIALIPLGKVWIQIFSLQLWVNSRTDWVLQPWWGN